MKLLYVHDFFGIGNSRYGYDICKLLVSRGHKIYVLAGVGKDGPSDGEIIDGISFHTYQYGFRFEKIPPYFLLYSLNKNRVIFEKLERQIHFDVLIFNQPLCFCGVARSPLAKKIPKVYNFLSPWATEWAIENTRVVNRSLPRKIYEKINIKSRNLLEEKALKKSDAIIILSNFMKIQLLKNHPTISEKKLHIIPGAIDIDRFTTGGFSNVLSREKLSIGKENFVILTVRRLVPRMGIENLIKAMPLILKKLPNAVLLIGGDGPLRLSLRQLAESLNCKDKIKFLGFIKDENLPSLYRLANLFVLPTRELEGFGLVILEAMASGTPVMATPVGAIPEILASFDKDMLFSGTTSSDIANGIIHFFKSNVQKNLGKKCREYTVLHYSWENVIDKIEHLLEKVVNNNL